MTVAIASDVREAGDARPRVVNPTNLGQFPNRRVAASLARGGYLK